ncbi:MAG: helix-turn-helix domain-containing protein [Ilumatobacter sp.]
MVASGSQPSSTSGSRTRLDLFKALGDNTRYAIYLELARAAKPLTTAEIAETIDLHPNTVRPHLDRMREAGLIDVEVGGRGEIGRPQHRYSLVADAPSLGLEPPVMPMLARLVLSMAERLGAGAADAHAVGRDEGITRSRPFASARSSLEAIVSDLDVLGFDPVVTDDVDDPDAAVIAFANCPFGELATTHPDLVCSLHHGLIAGLVAAMGDTVVREFRTVVDRTPCQVTVGAGAKPSG